MKLRPKRAKEPMAMRRTPNLSARTPTSGLAPMTAMEVIGKPPITAAKPQPKAWASCGARIPIV